MAYAEDDLLPISALQHLLFCERQCALIHLERVWVENRFTAEGQHLHRRAHEGPSETRDGVRITRGVPLRSLELGLAGVADVVQYAAGRTAGDGGTLRDEIGRVRQSGDWRGWTITPIEYKRGRPKGNDCDRVQLCAQALCLEEMLGASIATGEIFYGKNRRRTDVEFDAALRRRTREAAARLHELMESGRTPTARREKKCETCSLLSVCLPTTTGVAGSASRFVEWALEAALAED